MQPISVEQDLMKLDRSVEIFSRARPVQADILRAFQTLFRQRLRLVASLSERPLRLPAFDPAGIAHGRAWLDEVSLEPLSELLRESAHDALPAMARAFPEGSVFEELETLLLGPIFALPTACRELFEEDQASLDRRATAAGVAPALLRFALEATLSPVAMLLADRVSGPLQEQPWLHGSCPVCGRPPSIAYLAKREETGLDSLVGGGGQKHLHCSLCAHVWRFRRDACPGCGTSEPKSREIIHAADARHERIEFCTQCKGYHLSIDFRELEDEPDLLIAPVALMHLDMIAQGKGGLPFYNAPWNAVE